MTTVNVMVLAGTEGCLSPSHGSSIRLGLQQLLGRMQEASSTMAMDAYRRGDSLFVHFDLPGVDPGSIELTAEQNTLTVRADRRWTPEADDQILAQERPQGTFTRQLMLGEHLDTEHVQAAYEDGVLTIEIPIAPQAKPRKIEVRGGRERQGAIDVEGTSSASAVVNASGREEMTETADGAESSYPLDDI